MSGPRITLTGAGGALGLVLRPRLIARGAVLTSAGHRCPAPIAPGERVLGGDLRDDLVVDQALQGAEVVIHMARSSV